MRPKRHFENLTLDSGARIPGIISPPSETDRVPADFGFPAMVVRVRSSSILTAGRYIIYQGKRYLTLEHHSHNDWRTYRLMECNYEVEVVITNTILEPITGLPQDSGIPTVEKLWVSRKMIVRERPDYVTRIAEEKFAYLFPKEININALVDGERVKRVVPVLGVFHVETQ